MPRASNKAGKVAFLDLPNELLERIGTHCTCSTALALSCTSRRLRQTINSRHVYLAMLQEHWQIPEELYIDATDVLQCLKQWALADEKAQDLIEATSPEDEVPHLEDWAPMLMAAGHPVVTTCQARSLHSTLNAALVAGKPEQELAAIAFCLAAQCINVDGHEGVQFEMQAPHALDLQLSRLLIDDSTIETSGSNNLEDTLGDNLRQIPTGDEPNNKPGVVFFYEGLAAMASRISSLIVQSRRDSAQRPGVAARLRSRVLHTPTARRIPFSSIMDIPTPFSSYPADTFVTGEKIKKDLIEDGEWVAYYCHSFDPEAPIDFDEPMQKIKFRARFIQQPEVNDNHPMYRMQARGGIDGHGSFDFDGAIMVDTGSIVLTKYYTANRRNAWIHTGMWTPFGVVGIWCRNEAQASQGVEGLKGEGGWFWMFKKSWSVDAQGDSELEALP